MSLRPDEPRMNALRQLDDLDERRAAQNVMSRKDHAMLFEDCFILIVELVTMAVTFADLERTVRPRCERTRFENAIVGAETHRPAFEIEIPLFGQEVDDVVCRRFVDFGCHRVLETTNVARELDARQLHPVADTEEWNLIFASVLDRAQLSFHAARPEAGRYQDPFGTVEYAEALFFDRLRIDTNDLDRGIVIDAGVIERFVDRNVRVLELDVFTDECDTQAVRGPV